MALSHPLLVSGNSEVFNIMLLLNLSTLDKNKENLLQIPDPCQQDPNAIWSFVRVIRSPVGDEIFLVSFRYFYPEFTSLRIIILDITWIDKSAQKQCSICITCGNNARDLVFGQVYR